MHNQRQLEFRIAYGQMMPRIKFRPCQQIRKLILRPGININHKPGLVPFAKILGTHRFLKTLQNCGGIATIRMSVLWKFHSHGRAFKNIHSKIVFLRLTFGTYPVNATILATTRFTLESVVFSPSHGKPPRKAWECHRNVHLNSFGRDPCRSECPQTPQDSIVQIPHSHHVV